MKSIALGAFVLALAVPAVAHAHRLDEYLQATRVAFAGNRIELEIDLLPGVAIAPDVIARLDGNGDRTVSPMEAAAYAQLVLRDLILNVDQRPVALTLAHVEVAPFDEIRSGLGAIQLRAVGLVEGGGTGRRQVYFRNDHRPGTSVYSVNALIPEDANVRVLGQIRDPRQQEVRIDYSVGPKWLAQLLFVVLGTAGLFTLTMVRRRPGRLASVDGTS